MRFGGGVSVVRPHPAAGGISKLKRRCFCAARMGTTMVVGIILE